MAVAYRDQSRYVKALEYQNKALQIFKKLNDTLEIAGNLNNLALLHGRLNNYPEETKLYMEILDIEKRRKNYFGIARTTNNLANLCSKVENYDLAIKYFLEGLDAATKIGNKQFMTASYHGLSEIYLRKAEYSKAVEWVEKAIQVSSENKFYDFLSKHYNLMADIYIEARNNQKALEYLMKSYNILQQTANKVILVQTTIDIANLYLRMNKLDLAKKYADYTLALADSTQSLGMKTYALYALYQIQKKKNDYLSALSYLEGYVSGTDSLKKLQQDAFLQELTTKYEVKNMEEKNAQLEKQALLQQQVIDYQKRTIWISIGFSVIVLLLLIVLFINRRKLQEKKNQLIKQAEELKEANETKDKFFSIIAHDLRSPLSAVLGLTEVIVADYDKFKKEDILEFIKNIHESGQSGFSLLENLLEWSKSQMDVLEPVISEFSLFEMVDSELQRLSSLLENKQIKAETTIPPDFTVMADRNMLLLIIRNLIINAIKFTYPGGKITVSAFNENNNIIIKVVDTGVGMEKERAESLFKYKKLASKTTLGTQNEKGSGLGLMHCKEFVDKHKGDIRAESEPGNGSTFIITLPQKK